MKSVLLFSKRLLKEWWALMSCAVFTFLGLYSLIAGKSNVWIIATTLIASAALFLVAAFRIWHSEYKARLDTESHFQKCGNKAELKRRLAAFLLQGQDVIDQCRGNTAIDAAEANADQWHDSVIEYLKSYDDVSYLARFCVKPPRNDVSLPGIVGTRSNLLSEVNQCLDTLREFIAELKS